ncbi:hypothetical protein H5410_046751 [Solanum commersonii]|uniref:DUF1985 domain-containing protein n=1 Tax=Solanum commersonii TaxID=4109 RepID=A0A9J5XF59_SOLCO|nr:hypothetical protein H5410_046751 [Solanum commersonii]
MSMEYVIKQISTHSLKFDATYNMSFVDDFKLSIEVECIELFKINIFRSYLNISNCNYQGQITKCLLPFELEQDNTNKLHIGHANENILHFSIKEYAVITGLKCTCNSNNFRYLKFTPSKLFERYFPGAKTSMGESDNNQDAVQMTVLYFIHIFVFSQLGNTPISIDDFIMVEDGSLQVDETLRQEFTLTKWMYQLVGMPYALNNACTNIQLISEELATLDLPAIFGVSPSEPFTLAAKSKQVQSQELPEFEDFAIKPPEQ